MKSALKECVHYGQEQAIALNFEAHASSIAFCICRSMMLSSHQFALQLRLRFGRPGNQVARLYELPAELQVSESLDYCYFKFFGMVAPCLKNAIPCATPLLAQLFFGTEYTDRKPTL